MRWGMVLLGILTLCWLTGCGGGGGSREAKPVVVVPDEFRVSYFHWRVGTVSGNGGQDQEFFEVFGKLAEPQSSPIFGNMSLTLDGLSRAMIMNGPATEAPEDGISQEKVPMLIYWGVGDALPAGQPLTVQPGDWLPGYVRPGDFYFYTGHMDLAGSAALAAAPHVTADGGYDNRWSLPAGTMLPLAQMTYPLAPVINSIHPARLAWAEVPGATGYLVEVKGDVLDDQKNVVRRVIWTSAKRPIIFDALYDPTDDLLPASAREVTIPANVFAPCKAVQVSIFAQAPPDIDKSTVPTLKRVNASYSTYIFGTFQMK